MSTSAPTSETTVWLMALGTNGEYETPALEQGIALLGFQDVPNLTGLSGSEIENRVKALDGYTSESARTQGIVTGMMKQFALDMQASDIIVTPLKKQPGQIALGRIIGEYEHRQIEEDGEELRHTRKVKWNEDRILRADFGPDAFNYLVPKRTICRIKNADVTDRIRAHFGGPQPKQQSQDTDEPNPAIPDLAREQIIEHIHRRFPDRNLERLVAEVLKAQGFVVQQAGPGSDLGVDVLAGHGPLGFDPPRICVQVKHTSTASTQPQVQQLHGAMAQFDAEQALFVSWSDYTSDARKTARRDYFSIRLWNADDLLNAIYRVYDLLPEGIKSEIPLKPIWALVPEEIG